MQNQDLPIGINPGTNTNNGHRYGFTQHSANRGWNCFNQDHGRSCVFQFFGCSEQIISLLLASPLNLKPTENVNGLWREPNMSTDGYSLSGQLADYVSQPFAPFPFDHLCSGPH